MRLAPKPALFAFFGRRAGGWALGHGVVCLALGGCDGGNKQAVDSVCAPGRSVACAGPNGCDGRQVCNDDGDAFGDCECEDAGQTSTGGGGGSSATDRVAGTNSGGTGSGGTNSGGTGSGGTGSGGTGSGGAAGQAGDGGTGGEQSTTCAPSPGCWNVETVSDVDPGDGWHGRLRLALDSNDTPHVVFSTADDTASYARREGAEWVVETIDAPAEFPSLAIDATDTVHVCYVGFPGYTGVLHYGTRTGGGWSTEPVALSSTCGGLAVPLAAYSCEIAIAGSASPRIATMARHDGGDRFCIVHSTEESDAWQSEDWGTAGSEAIAGPLAVGLQVDSLGVSHVAHVYMRTGGGIFYASSAVAPIDFLELTDGDAGEYFAPVSLGVDSGNNPSVAFTSFLPNADNTGFANAVAYASNVDGTWSTEEVPCLQNPRGGRITLDAMGRPHGIASEFDQGGALFYFTRRAGGWYVEPLGESAAMNDPELAVGAEGSVYILFRDDEGVKLASRCP